MDEVQADAIVNQSVHNEFYSKRLGGDEMIEAKKVLIYGFSKCCLVTKFTIIDFIRKE